MKAMHAIGCDCWEPKSTFCNPPIVEGIGDFADKW